MSSVRTFARSTAVASVALILVVGATFAHDAALVRSSVVSPVVNVDTEDAETGDVGLETGDIEDVNRPEIDDQIENVGDSAQPVNTEATPNAEAPAKAAKAAKPAKPAKVAKATKTAKTTKAAKTPKTAEAADADDANEQGDANEANDQGDANDVGDTENSQSGGQQDSTDSQQGDAQQGDSSNGGGD